MNSAPRVLMLSKALVVGIYQRKLVDLARLGIDLTAAVPPSWRDERGDQPLERLYTAGYRLEILPLWFNGSFHLHTYRGLGRLIRDVQPDVVHIDEEPYNAAAWQAYWHAKRGGARTVVFTWQNIARHYPPPFSWGERWLLNGIDLLIAGTESAAEVWRGKGYSGEIAVIAQFGTDPTLFRPAARPERPFTVGYFGRLVPEKGVTLLLDALAALQGDFRLLVVGSGPERAGLAEKAAKLGLSDRIQFVEHVPSAQMPAMYGKIDVLALPSLTRPNWKEQFGRVLVEAMCSGVPVIGSDSGAIPSVIGDAGMIVPEGDCRALSDAISRLREDAGLYARLARDGRERAERYFSNAAVAQETAKVYQRLLQVS